MNIYDTEDFNDMFDAINKNFNSSFNDSPLPRLSIRENFENSVHSSTALAFDESNRIVKESDESISKRNVIKRKVTLKVLRQKIVAHKTKSKINFRKRNKKSKTNSTDKVKRRRFKSED